MRVVRDNMTGVSKGFGYVDFEVSYITLYKYFKLYYLSAKHLTRENIISSQKC